MTYDIYCGDRVKAIDGCQERSGLVETHGRGFLSPFVLKAVVLDRNWFLNAEHGVPLLVWSISAIPLCPLGSRAYVVAGSSSPW